MLEKQREVAIDAEVHAFSEQYQQLQHDLHRRVHEVERERERERERRERVRGVSE